MNNESKLKSGMQTINTSTISITTCTTHNPIQVQQIQTITKQQIQVQFYNTFN